MQLTDKVKMFRDIVNEMADLYEKKNSNYGDSFGQLYDTLGPISGLVPLHNKLDRATSLIKGDKNNFESLEDTFKDLACYAIMNLIEMKSRATCYPDVDNIVKPTDVKDPKITTFPSKPLVDGDSISSVDPCVCCPWNQNVLFNNGKPYVGDTPCQWCEHGKLTHANINYCTSTTTPNPDHIKTTLDVSINTIDNTTLTTSNMIDERYEDDYFDFDDLTDDEIRAMAEEEAKYYSNIFNKLMTKRGADNGK